MFQKRKPEDSLPADAVAIYAWNCPLCGTQQVRAWYAYSTPKTAAGRLCPPCSEVLLPRATEKALHSPLTLDEALEKLAAALEKANEQAV